MTARRQPPAPAATRLPWAGRRALLIVLATAAGPGCAALPPPDLKPPEVRLSGLSIDRLDFTSTRFELMIEAFNPNRDDVVLTAIHLELSILDVVIGPLELPTDRVLLAGDRLTRLPVGITVPTRRLLDLGARARDGGLMTPSWRLAGSARWGDRGATLPIVKEGKIDLREWFGGLFGR